MIRKYLASDYDEVMSWLDARGMKKIHSRILPENGFIIPGIGAVWIYKTDSDICFIEELYSNPKAESKREHIDQLIMVAIEAAKEMGFKFIQSVTSHPSIIKRAVLLGAKIETLQTLITLQIK